MPARLNLAPAALLLVAACAQHPWGQFGRSATHTSRGVSAGPTTTAPTVLWHTSPTSNDSAPIFVTAAVSSAGAVFFSQIDGCAASLDAATGAQRWSTCLQDRVSFFLGSPALSSDGSRVYFSTATNMSILALDTSTGAIAWRFQGSAASAFSGSPAVADDGSIYAGAEDGYLYVLSPAGALLGSYYCGVSIFSTPALGPTPPSARTKAGVDGSALGSSVYVASSAGTLTALDAALDAGSKALWSVALWAQGGPLDWGWQSSPTVSDDGARLYIGSWDGALLCLAAVSGEVVWRLNVSATLGVPAPYIISTPSLSVPGVGRALVYSGTVYRDNAVVDAYGTLFAADAATGALVWQTRIATSLVTAPVVGTGGELYISGYSGDGIPGGALQRTTARAACSCGSSPWGSRFTQARAWAQTARCLSGATGASSWRSRPSIRRRRSRPRLLHLGRGLLSRPPLASRCSEDCSSQWRCLASGGARARGCACGVSRPPRPRVSTAPTRCSRLCSRSGQARGDRGSSDTPSDIARARHPPHWQAAPMTQSCALPATLIGSNSQRGELGLSHKETSRGSGVSRRGSGASGCEGPASTRIGNGVGPGQGSTGSRTVAVMHTRPFP